MKQSNKQSHKVLWVGPTDTDDGCQVSANNRTMQPVQVQTLGDAIDVLIRDPDADVGGVFVDKGCLPSAGELAGMRQSLAMLHDMAHGVALLDDEYNVLWCNRHLRQWSQQVGGDIDSTSFFSLLGDPEIVGPDYCPFHTALAMQKTVASVFLCQGNRYFEVKASPVFPRSTPLNPDQAQSPPKAATPSAVVADGLAEIDRQEQQTVPDSELAGDAGMLPSGVPGISRLVVSVTDISEETLQRQKLEAIYKAGSQLTDLQPDEIYRMDVDDRIELLKENVKDVLANILNFETIEIRVLNARTGLLDPLLCVGLDDEAGDRCLYARPEHNGVTGLVAHTGRGYLCQQAVNDPLFLPGMEDSLSSITAPLVLNDLVLGTINVESDEENAFTNNDLNFLEIFARDIARALNTLDLLTAEKANTAQQSCNAIHSAVARPIDEILNHVVKIKEDYLGHSPEMEQRLGSVLNHARDIKDLIYEIGQQMAPLEAVPAGMQPYQYENMAGKRVLVVDGEQDIRDDAHTRLEQFGCIVETAHDGTEAVQMVKNTFGCPYDVIISAIHLEDFSGYQLLRRLMEQMDHVPMILMTGFGYDPGHSLVNARRIGLHQNAVLFKPFRVDQLVTAIETTLDGPGIKSIPRDMEIPVT
ncbi:MAG: response regulator [Planctomycetota bacterium]